ncbi:MAG: type II toxin-antitoxin system RelE/ParE family toxin [Paracoccaceae bacterium]
MKLDVSAEAKADIRALYVYSVRHWGRARASVHVDDIREKMRSLAKGDLPGAAADEVGPGLRRQIAGSHAIWFRVEGERLRVVRVLHQSRDAGVWVGLGGMNWAQE